MATDTPSPPSQDLDAAFKALNHYLPGSNRADLLPIDNAVTACLQDAELRTPLERRLLQTLAYGVSSVSGNYICDKLVLIGGAASVPTLALLLSGPDAPLADGARRALEAIGAPAATALRSALSETSGSTRIGIINSLGRLRDSDSVAILHASVDSIDQATSNAAIAALGSIGTKSASVELMEVLQQASETQKNAITDACLVCAEQLQADGLSAAAKELYEGLMQAETSSNVQAAAKRGLGMD